MKLGQDTILLLYNTWEAVIDPRSFHQQHYETSRPLAIGPLTQNEPPKGGDHQTDSAYLCD